MISLTFPPPPSANNLYANVPGKGRVRLRAYKAWIDGVGWIIKAQTKDHIIGKFVLTVWLPPGIDLDNIKAIADLLGPPKGQKKHGLSITEDDKHMHELHVYRTSSVTEQCRVQIEEAKT